MIAKAHRIALRIRPAGGIQDMDHRLGHPQSIKKLVAQPLSQVGVGHQAGHVYQLDGNEPRAVLAPSAALFDPQLPAGAGSADIGHAVVGIDGGEGVVCNIHIDKSRRLEKGGFAGVGLSSQPYGEHQNQ